MHNAIMEKKYNRGIPNIKNTIQIMCFSFSLIYTFPAIAQGLAYGAKYAYGQIELKTTLQDEVDKTGDYQVKELLLDNKFGWGLFGIGLGMYTSDISGMDFTKDLKQRFNRTFLLIDTYSIYRIYGKIYTGLILQTLAGNDANYAKANKMNPTFMSSLGPIISLRQSFGWLDIYADSEFVFNINNRKRNIKAWQFAIGTSISLPTVGTRDMSCLSTAAICK